MRHTGPVTGGERSLGLSGAPNARDLGGLPVRDGVVRPGLLLRAPALGRLTDEDVAVLGGYGLTDLLDLRHGSEIEVAPADRLPGGLHVAHIPIFDPAHPVFTYVSAVLLGQDLSEYQHLGMAGTPYAMRQIYRWFVESPMARAGFSTALHRIAEASGPLVFHCSAGKDRTGWLSVVLLTALGAGLDTATADYLATNTLQAGVNESIMRRLRDRRGIAPATLAPVLTAAPEYLAESLAAVERGYGGFDGYLRDALEVDDELVERLRKRLVRTA
jgi:protein-tyrosine phosphatase